MECWGRESIWVAASWQWWNNIAETSSTFGGYTYPEAFIATPVCTYTLESTNDRGLVGAEPYNTGSATVTPRFYVMSGVRYDSGFTIYANFHAIGRWKA